MGRASLGVRNRYLTRAQGRPRCCEGCSRNSGSTPTRSHRSPRSSWSIRRELQRPPSPCVGCPYEDVEMLPVKRRKLSGLFGVERVLGIGGMGVVVAAHHIQLDTKVALKFLLPDALYNSEAVARFAREARAAVKIKSEHVARVSDVGTLPNGAPYMVMAYCSETVPAHGIASTRCRDRLDPARRALASRATCVRCAVSLRDDPVR